MYLLMVLFSKGLEMFPLFGRHARQMVPFLCLTTACGLTYFADNWWLKSRVWLVGTFAIVLQAVFNFTQPLTQQFPNDVVHRVMATYGHVAQDTTIVGPETTSEDSEEEGNIEIAIPSRYVLLNALHLLHVPGVKAPPYGKVLFSVTHPLQFLPYQYEGFSLMERLILRSTDISMRLIDTQVVP